MAPKTTEFSAINNMANITLFKVIQGRRFSDQTKARKRLSAEISYYVFENRILKKTFWLFVTLTRAGVLNVCSSTGDVVSCF